MRRIAADILNNIKNTFRHRLEVLFLHFELHAQQSKLQFVTISFNFHPIHKILQPDSNNRVALCTQSRTILIVYASCS